MKRKYYWIVGIMILILIFIILIYNFYYSIYLESFMSGRIPKIGESYELYVYSHYEPVFYSCTDYYNNSKNKTCMNETFVDGIKVTLNDIIKGTVQTNITNAIKNSGIDKYTGEKWFEESHGFTSFGVIVGNKYLISAEFENSNKSVSCTIGPNENGFVGRLDIIISGNNTIKDIECLIVGFL